MNRAALITGAAGGIGQALCHAFAGAGYHVVGTDIHETSVDGTFIQADLRRLCREEALRLDFRARVVAAAGDASLHAIVNNAAVQILGATSELTTADWGETFDVNVLAPFLLGQLFLADLERGRGSIVNIASIHATVTKPGFVCYATSKAALVGLTKSMAVDLGSRVRVNAILPAAIESPMLVNSFAAAPNQLQELGGFHPVGRIGTPIEVARSAVFLASDEASFMTGSCLQLDGGMAGRLHDPS